MVDLFGAEVPSHRPHGVLSVGVLFYLKQLLIVLFKVEHDPRNNRDGACVTMLVAFRSPLEEVPIIGKCVWHELPKHLGEQLLGRVASRNSTIPINVIR